VAQAVAPEPFVSINPATFTVTDNEPAEVEIALLDNPGTAKPAVFLEADGIRFSECRLDFDAATWNVPKKVKLWPKTSFDPANNVQSIFGVRLGWASDPKKRHKTTQSVTFTRNVTPGRICNSAGDPHFISFDQRFFDYWGMDCYTLLQAPNLIVQVRHAPWHWGNPAAAINVGMALVYGSVMWRVDPLQQDPNARFQMLSPNTDGVEVIKSNNDCDVRFRMSDGAIVKLTLYTPGTATAYMDIETTVPACYKGKTAGLCGKYDDDVNNDFTMPDGNVVQDANIFGASWKIPAEDDMFARGYDAAVKAKVAQMPLTYACTLPTDDIMNATGLTPDPPGYEEVPATAQAVEYEVTPLPDPPAAPANKERRDPAWTKFVTDLCTEMILFKGVDKLKNIPTHANHLKGCVEDCQLGGLVDPIDSYRVAYQREVHTRISEEMDKFKICAATKQPRPRTATEIAAFVKEIGLDKFDCPVNCSGHGDCMTYGCQCQAGWAAFDCSVDIKAREKAFLDAEKAGQTQPAQRRRR
jgi:hypothetical protein